MLGSEKIMQSFLDAASKDFNKQMKLIGGFMRLLRERATIEYNYARGLEGIVHDMNEMISQGMDSDVMCLLRNFHLTKLEQSRSLYESIEGDTKGVMDVFLSQKKAGLSKKIEAMNMQDKNLKNLLERIDKLKFKYVDEIGVNKNKQSNTSKQQGPKQIEQTRNDLYMSISQYNSSIGIHQQAVNEVKKYLKVVDEDIVTMMRDTLMKTVIYELSAIKNVQYDIDKIPKSLEKVDSQTSGLPLTSEKITFKFSKINAEEFLDLLTQNTKVFKNKEIVYEDANEAVDTNWPNFKNPFPSDLTATPNEKYEAAKVKKIQGIVQSLVEEENIGAVGGNEVEKLFEDKMLRAFFVEFCNQIILNRLNEINFTRLTETKFYEIIAEFYLHTEKQRDWQLGIELYEKINKSIERISAEISQLKAEGNQDELLQRLRSASDFLTKLRIYIRSLSIFQNTSFCVTLITESIKEELKTNNSLTHAKGNSLEMGQRDILMNLIASHLKQIPHVFKSPQETQTILKHLQTQFNLNEKESFMLTVHFETSLGKQLNAKAQLQTSSKENFQSWVVEMEEKINDIQISKEHRRDMHATRKIFSGIPKPAKQGKISHYSFVPFEPSLKVLAQKTTNLLE